MASNLRKIKNGQIRYRGDVYYPDFRDSYNGELDGQHWYIYGYDDNGEKNSFITLVSCNDEPYNDPHYPFEKAPNCINGEFKWHFWHMSKEKYIEVVENKELPFAYRWDCSCTLASWFEMDTYREALRAEYNATRTE